MLLLMQPRTQLAFWAVSAHCWVMLSFLSTNTPKSFSARLLYTPSSPSLYWWQVLPQPSCRTMNLALLNLMVFTQAHFWSCPGPYGWHLVPQVCQLHHSAWCHLQTCWGCAWSLYVIDEDITPCSYGLHTPEAVSALMKTFEGILRYETFHTSPLKEKQFTGNTEFHLQPTNRGQTIKSCWWLALVYVSQALYMVKLVYHCTFMYLQEVREANFSHYSYNLCFCLEDRIMYFHTNNSKAKPLNDPTASHCWILSAVPAQQFREQPHGVTPKRNVVCCSTSILLTCTTIVSLVLRV